MSSTSLYAQTRECACLFYYGWKNNLLSAIKHLKEWLHQEALNLKAAVSLILVINSNTIKKGKITTTEQLIHLKLTTELKPISN
jgi:hypothetical protein